MLAVTPNASHLVACSRSLVMRIFSVIPSQVEVSLQVILLRTLKPHTSPVVTSAIDHTGTLLATGGADGVVKVWDIRGGYVTHSLHGHKGVVSALHFFELSEEALRLEVESISTAKNKKRKAKSRHGHEDLDESAAEVNQRFRLASGAEDGQIRIWSLHKRDCRAALDAHASVVRSLDFCPTSNVLVSASRDKMVMTWDALTWTMRTTIPVLEVIESVGFVAGGAIIYTGGEHGRLRLWEVNSGREVTSGQEPGNETEGITSVIYHSGLPYALSVHVNQTLSFHSLGGVTGDILGKTISPLPIPRRISGNHDEVIDLAYVGSDRSLLALATNLEDIRIISLTSPEVDSRNKKASALGGHYFGADVAFLKGHEDIIICLDVDWSGSWLVTGAKDNTARLWQIDPKHDTYTCRAILTGHAESLGAVALPRSEPAIGSPAHIDPLNHPPLFLITGSQDKTIKRWDLSSVLTSTGKVSRATYTRKAHDRNINAIDTNHNSTLFASASQDRTIKIWSLEDGEPIGVLRGHRRGVWSVKFAPKDTPAITGDSLPTSGSKGLILTGSGDKTVKIWSLSDYSCLRTFEGHTNSVLKVLWLPLAPNVSSNSRSGRGTQVVSAGGDGLVKVWDVRSGELATTLDNHIDRVWALATHPNPPSASSNAVVSSLISGGGDSTITFWRDTSAETATAAIAASTERVEQDQRLQNYTRSGNYREAITLALQLDHPARLLGLFTAVIDTYPPEANSLTGVKAVDETLANLGDEQLFKLLLRLRDWNTNARTAPVAQRILWTIMKSYPASRLEGLRGRGRGAGGLREVLYALKAYTERHLSRLQEMVDESYLVEYTLRQMDEVGGVGKGLTNGHIGQDNSGKDIVTIDQAG